MTDAVADALQKAHLIVFCPSNPVLSVEPILAVPGVREALKARCGPCVAVSPFVGGKAVKGPASKLMPELGLGISPDGLLRYYTGLLDGLVIDVSDRDNLPSGGISVLITPTLMQSDEDRIALARKVLEWASGIAA
jgi:LPPG:FO 2-phospho-L-lactate transferase